MIGTTELIIIAGLAIAFFGVAVVKKWVRGAKDVKKIWEEEDDKKSSK